MNSRTQHSIIETVRRMMNISHYSMCAVMYTVVIPVSEPVTMHAIVQLNTSFIFYYRVYTSRYLSYKRGKIRKKKWYKLAVITTSRKTKVNIWTAIKVSGPINCLTLKPKSNCEWQLSVVLKQSQIHSVAVIMSVELMFGKWLLHGGNVSVCEGCVFFFSRRTHWNLC